MGEKLPFGLEKGGEEEEGGKDFAYPGPFQLFKAKKVLYECPLYRGIAKGLSTIWKDSQDELKLKLNGIENMCITGLCEATTDVRRGESLIYWEVKCKFDVDEF